MSKVEDLHKSFRKGDISRREFMRKMAIIGCATMVSPLILNKTLMAASPQRGGRLRMGMAGGAISDTLDPALLNDWMIMVLNWQLRNCLVEVTHEGRPIPELVESWESSADAATWIFNLRKGVEFHNGKTLDAEDVLFSMNRHRGEGSKSVARSYLKAVKELKADGKHRVVFKLERGNADFPFYMSDTHLTIIPDGTSEFNKGIGTGGYTLVDFNPGVRTFVKRNPNYWKKGRAHFDEIEMLCINDGNARTNALQTKAVDVMNRCELKTADMLKKRPGIKVIQVTGSLHYTFPMRTDLAPFDNNDVRLALKYAIDREQLLNTILRGYGSIGNDTPIGPTYQYYAKDLPQRSYDPDKAKYHLKKAGLSNHTLTIHASNAAFAGGEDAALLYSEQARKAGINITVKREPKDGYWKNVWMKKPWSMSYYSGKPTEDWMFSQAYSIESKWNETFWTNKRFNDLLVQARSELNNDKRRDMYVEMQHIMWNEGGTIIPLFGDFVYAINNKVKYSELAGNYDMDGLRCSERWWFAG